MTDDTLARAQRLVSGFRGFQILVTACKLKLPDFLATGPKTAEELAKATDTHAPAMRRLLRGLAAWEMVAEKDDGRFEATALSEMFRADKPGLRQMAVMLSEEGYTVWGELSAVIRTGEPAFERLYGKPRWEMLGENPEAAAVFNAAMVETSMRAAASLIASYDFSPIRTVVDVGGGNGALLAAIL
ncbi:MAG TPA: methyltransferase, partial [Candidatus Sulfotelmatobacter sp.]|nr:methyltransferase [Candidatus Sulfotelmatobacter sp.]